MSTQAKRKQPTPAAPTVASATDAPFVKKQRQEQSTPQFLDFETEEAILPRDEIKKSKTKSLRHAGSDDLFSSKRNMDDSEPEDEEKNQTKTKSEGKNDFKKNLKSSGASIGRAHSLNITQVAVGDVILGTITKITPYQLKVALPEGVTGSINYRDISDTLTALFDAQIEEHMSDSTPNKATQLDIISELPSLEELFVVGQQITPMITAIKTKVGKNNLRLRCSLRPSIVNSTYTQVSNIPSYGIPMQGDIESVQEKGFIVNFGLPFKGFVPYNEAKAIDSTTYIKGQLVTALLPKDKEISKDERSVNVSLDSSRILHQAIPYKAEIAFEQVRAGQFYIGTVSKHLSEGGLCVQILGSFDATITALQLPPLSTASQYPLASTVIIRVLYSNSKTKAIAATLRADLVSPKSLYGPNINFSTMAHLGDIKQAKIIQVIGKALVVQFINDVTGTIVDYSAIKTAQQADFNANKVLSNKFASPILGWLPLVGISDLPITDFPKQFKVGATVSTRVLGFNFTSGLIQLTAKPSLLQAQALSYNDVEPGQKYHGIVVSTLQAPNYKPEKDEKKTRRPKHIANGVILQISPKVTAFVPIQQLVNQGGAKTNALLAKKFSLGSQHDLCVLVCDAATNKVIATTKPALLARCGIDEVFTDYAHARTVFTKHRQQAKPLILGGYVERCTDKYVVIRYMNNISGVVTKEMLVSQGVIAASQSPEYTVGEYILTRVLAVYDDKLSLSLVVSAEDQQKSQTKEKVQSTTPRIGSIASSIQVVSVAKDENDIPQLVVKFAFQDKEFTGILSQLHMTDIPSHQPHIFSKSSKAGFTFPHAIVLGVSEDDIVHLTVKPSYFLLYAYSTPTSFDTITAADSYSNMATALVDIARNGDVKVSSVKIPRFGVEEFTIGTIQSIDQNGLRVMISSKYYAYIQRRNIGSGLIDESTELENYFKLGQTVAISFSKAGDDKIFYRIQLPKLFKSYPAKMSLFQKYLSMIDTVEQKLFRTSSRSDLTLKGVTLGQTIANAKVTKFNTDNVIFSSTESLKGNFKLICQDVEFHAPTITEATIGTTTDVTIIGFNIAKKTAYVTTLDIYHSKGNKTLSPDLVGKCTKAILLHGGASPTVSIPDAENIIIPLQPTPELLINYQSYEFFAEGLVAGASITVFPYTSTKAAFVSNYQRSATVSDDAVYPEGSFYDEAVKCETNIQPGITTQAKVIGLVRTSDLSPVSPEEYDSVTDLYRYSILAQLGEISQDPSNPTIADRYLSLIALSDLTDPTVASTKSKKTSPTTTNALTYLKQLLQNADAIVQAKVISQSPIADSVKVPAVSKSPLQKFLTQLSLRNSDFNTEDYKSRTNPENYQIDTVHNAVVLQLDEEVGIFAQVTPSIYAIIRPSACGVKVVTTKGKKATTTSTALPFANVTDKCQIGDIISFKLKTEPTVQNDMTILHSALVHSELNATGIDAEEKTEYDLNLELISSYTQGAKYNPIRQYTIGQCVNNARVIKLRDDRYIVGLSGNALGEINFAEIKDEMDSKFNPLTHFAPGDIIPRVVVVSMKKQMDGKQIYVCSARSSRADLITPPQNASASTIENSTAIRFALEQFAVKNGCQFDHEIETKGASLVKPTDLLVSTQLQRLHKVSGVVSAVGEHGTFVQLSGVLNAVIDRDASTRFKSLTVGKVQSFIVKFVTAEGGVVLTDNLSTKPTMSNNLEDSQLFDSLQRGMVIKGVVHSITDHGVFVTLQDSTNLTALAFKTHCVDDFHDDWRKLFKVGQKTKGVITRIDRTERQISLSLKQSAISAAEKQQAVKTKEQLANDVSDQTTQQLLQAQARLEKEQKALQITAAKEQKVLSTLFDPLATVNKKSKKDKNLDDEEELIDFDVDSGLTSQLQQMNKSGQMSDKDATERRIEMLEHVLVGLGDNTVTAGSFSIENASAQQFELKCASQPNNASFWISFMAFHLENNEVTKARDIVQRALKMMSVSSLSSRWSMYSSLLSIEILYGTPTSLETAIAQAIKEFEKIKVYNEVGRIAITSAKYRIAIDYYVKSLRSSGLAQDKASNANKPRHLLQSVQDIYISLISLHFAQQNRTECNSFLKQAITQLPSQYSSFIMIKTILLEFQSDHGSTVQGRTMFQTFLKDNIKRLDVWTTWIQQEIKVCKKLYQTIQLNSNTITQAKKTEFKQQKTRVRELFDIFTTKAVNQYNIAWSTFKPTQVKSIYALAIEFENSPVCNNDSRSDTIKQRAAIYVEEISSTKQ